MKPSTYIILFICGVLGEIFHLVTKAQSIKESSKVANVSFNYNQFINDEIFAIVSTLVTLVIAIVIIDEFLVYEPKVEPYLKVSFIFLGYTGSSILVNALGKAQTRVNAIIDEKTNIADNK